MTSSNNHHEEGFASCEDTVQESHQQVLSSSTEKRKHHHQRSSSSPIAIIRSSGSSPSSSPTTTTTTTNSTSTGNSSSSSNNHTDAPSSFPHKASHHHPHRKTRKPSPLLLHHQQQQQNSEMMFMNNMMSSTLINHHGSNNLLNPQTTTSLRNDFEAFHALGQSATSSMLFPSLNPSPSQGVVNMSSTNSNGSSHNDTTMNNDTIASMNDMHNMVMDPMTLASALLSGQINLTALNEEQLNTLRLLISHPQQLSPQTQQQVGHSENYASNNMLFMNPNTQELVTNTTGIDSHMHVRRHSVASQMSLDSVYSPSMNNQKTFSSTLNVPSSNLFQESPTTATPQEGGHSLDPASSNMPSNATEIIH
ncbi:hypothetical protein C9374_009207 [Naegleria lovaniensis]|uniref:Uncharacterized protein n=1 Tax=Naegleria lovaniensis TaxID=51637 RepID=A0AA88GJN6_NAELO|nr:uncharacterized protein C9374_009207 [Naegleria lovaniensis]KAG2377691.1 hypothetical protein C9374_009207 [Naegleria lovaniensis]